MPELPEVETVARELRDTIAGRRIGSLHALWEKSFDNRCGIPLEGQQIASVERKGKYLIINLEHTFLIVHLRMTGQLLYFAEGSGNIGKHVRIRILFEDQSELLFKDMRKFGRIYHVCDKEEILREVGVDALNPELDKNYFKALLKKSNMNLKAFLLSQKYISGLGNIYVDESLFRARLHPGSIASGLSESKYDLLFDTIRHVLKIAVRNMGSTISDYRDTYGNAGNNQKFFKVYGRTGLPCYVCGMPVEKIRLAGRGTHFCPSCQKSRN